jgi:hypothetical protein
MKKIIVAFILGLFFASSLLPSVLSLKNLKDASDTCSFDDAEYYAVIVGIEEFSGFETPTQEYLDESAIAFYEKLINSSNWKQENILLLLNENATKDKIHEALTVWLADKENESDVVVFYVATHGWKTKLKDRIHGNAYFFTHNSSDFLYDEETKITDKELDGWLDMLDSKHIAIILENCYSGRFFAVRQSGRTLLTAGGKYLFCPCNWSTYLEDTMFGFFFRQALDGVADINNDGWVTVQEAYHHLRLPVIWYSTWYHFPYLYRSEYGIRPLFPQIPFLYDRHIGSIPLIKL